MSPSFYCSLTFYYFVLRLLFCKKIYGRTFFTVSSSNLGFCFFRVLAYCRSLINVEWIRLAKRRFRFAYKFSLTIVKRNFVSHPLGVQCGENTWYFLFQVLEIMTRVGKRKLNHHRLFASKGNTSKEK